MKLKYQNCLPMYIFCFSILLKINIKIANLKMLSYIKLKSLEEDRNR